MLFTTPGLADYVSGVILFDETLRQSTKDGLNFGKYLEKNGILPGIKVDAGAHDMALHPGEKVTEGLDGLAKRMDEYFKLGARFAKWRAVITIVEPEVLLDGSHSAERSETVHEDTLAALFHEIERQGVSLEHLILKAS